MPFEIGNIIVIDMIHLVSVVGTEKRVIHKKTSTRKEKEKVSWATVLERILVGPFTSRYDPTAVVIQHDLASVRGRRDTTRALSLAGMRSTVAGIGTLPLA